MRLDKFIANTSPLSRSEVKRALHKDRITVDGVAERDGGIHIGPQQTIALDGEVLRWPGPRYFMLNKPEGYVCATSDSEHPIVLDLLNEPNQATLQIAGRLDIDTTGLVLITDDGQWNHRVTSPRSHCDKVYHVTLADDICAEAEARLSEGLMLDGEAKPTLPAHLQRLAAKQARLTIKEGKYHQVKRMFAALGNRVIGLHREQIGEIILDPNLSPGEYRPLTPAEIAGIDQR